MNRITLILISLLLLSLNAMAGTGLSYACDGRAQCTYSTDDDGTYDCDEYEAYNSLFELDESGTMFTHTIAGMQSTYYVKSTNYDNDIDALVLEVVSDAGNYYTYFFYKYEDKVIAKKGTGYGSYLIRFHVKNIF